MNHREKELSNHKILNKKIPVLCGLLCIVSLMLMMGTIFGDKVVDKQKLCNDEYIIERLDIENNFVYRDFKKLTDSDLWISISNIYTASNIRNEKMTTTQYGSRLAAEDSTVTIYHKDGPIIAEFHLLNHEHSYFDVKIPPTQEKEGYLYKVCSECDSVVLDKKISPLSPIKASISNGMKDSKISWDSAGEVTGYEVWRSVNGGEFSLYKTVQDTFLTVPATTVATTYKVRCYIEDGEEIIYGAYSNVVNSQKVSTISLNVGTKSVNGYCYQTKTYNKVQLTWSPVADATNYVIYKSVYSTKKYSKCATVKSGSKATITGLSSNKYYYFKIRAYDSSGKYIESKPLKVYILSKSDGYFYDKCIWNSTWDNVLITSSKASTATMNAHEVNGYKPYVKYNYCTKENILYIHNYLTFEGAGVNKTFAYYKYKKGKYVKSKGSKTTYRSLVLSGIPKYWNITIKGNKYDFISGCNFKTKVINHTTGFAKDQKVMNIKIGTPKVGKYYWFCATGSSSGTGGMKLATQQQLATNKNKSYHPETGMDKYRNVVSHEYGHNLGLDDTYAYDSKTPRVVRNSETGYYVKKKYRNIMYGTRTAHAVGNDIEMALQAQAISTGPRPVKQYYRTHYVSTNIGKIKNTKSAVVRR